MATRRRARRETGEPRPSGTGGGAAEAADIFFVCMFLDYTEMGSLATICHSTQAGHDVLRPDTFFEYEDILKRPDQLAASGLLGSVGGGLVTLCAPA